MKQVRLLFILIRPSLLSGIVCSLAALGIIAASNWDTALQNPLMVEYLFGQKGIVTLLQSSPSGFGAFTQVALSGSAAYNAAIIAIAVVVGAVVYVLLEGFDRTKLSFIELWQGLHDSNARFRQAVRADASLRFGTRLFALAFGLLYFFLSLKALLPLGLALSQEGLADPQGNNPLNSLLAFTVLFGALHGHVLIWRLITLRPRLFGSKTIAVELLEQAQSH